MSATYKDLLRNFLSFLIVTLPEVEIQIEQEGMDQEHQNVETYSKEVVVYSREYSIKCIEHLFQLSCNTE